MTMKRIYYILLILSALVCSCDKLPLQKSYPYDPQPLDPHQGVTCWEYISSAGIRVFLGAYKKMLANGGAMRIEKANDMVREVFEMTGLSQMLYQE